MKQIEEIINENEVYRAGLYWTDQEFNERKDAFMHVVGLSPTLCYYAGLFFTHNRFREFESTIIKGVGKEAKASYKAGLDWSDEKFEIASKDILNAILPSPKDCWKVGMDWNDERYSLVKNEILEGLDPLHARAAFNQWKRSRVLESQEKLIEKIISSSEGCYIAGRWWDDELFNKTKIDLFNGILSNDYYIGEARKFWKKERIKEFDQYRRESRKLYGGELSDAGPAIGGELALTPEQLQAPPTLPWYKRLFRQSS